MQKATPSYQTSLLHWTLMKSTTLLQHSLSVFLLLILIFRSRGLYLKLKASYRCSSGGYDFMFKITRVMGLIPLLLGRLMSYPMEIMDNKFTFPSELSIKGHIFLHNWVWLIVGYI